MSLTNPLISIIVPVFNTEQYLENCINSVLRQNYNNIELILVNDGSTDKSGEVCNSFREKDKRVVVFHEVNKGAASARNKGLEVASGDFIMFLDSDDYWVDDCLLSIVNRLEEYKFDVDVLFLKNAVVKKDGTLTEFRGYEFDYFNRSQLAKYISTQQKVAVSACLKVLNKKMFNNKMLYFEDSLLAEDIDWFFSLLSVANSFITYNGDFYCYRILENSASRTPSDKRIKDYIYILNKWVNKAETMNKLGIKHKDLYYMLGYEYEILLSTLYDYSKDVREEYLKKLEELFWVMEYRNRKRSTLIKFFKNMVGFRMTCKILNFYLHHRVKN